VLCATQADQTVELEIQSGNGRNGRDGLPQTFPTFLFFGEVFGEPFLPLPTSVGCVCWWFVSRVRRTPGSLSQTLRLGFHAEDSFVRDQRTRAGLAGSSLRHQLIDDDMRQEVDRRTAQFTINATLQTLLA
jgi:hypothetical protein